MTTYSKTSPYSKTTNNGFYLDVIEWRDIPPKADDVPWEVTTPYMHRPDLLAFDLYGETGYWWVFSVRNKGILKDPVYDLIPGRTIYLPTLETIRTALG